MVLNSPPQPTRENDEDDTMPQPNVAGRADLADDSQAEMLNDLDITAGENHELSQDEVFYGKDDDQYDYDYYDNEDEWQTYDGQEIKYHEDMTGK